MSKTQIAIINSSTVLTDDQIMAVVPALQTQIKRDFAPVWGADADLIFVPKGAQPPQHVWWLVILDTMDTSTELGYHELTDQGLPIGKVFAGSEMKLGYQWTATVSHELLELLIDPYIHLTVFVQLDANTGMLYAYEVADACQAESLGYDINGVRVSDFVFPAWFQPFHLPGSTQFDFCNHIQKPLQVLPGGYIGVFNFASNMSWHQMTAGEEVQPDALRLHREIRRQQCRTSGDQWLKSVVKAS